MLTEQELIAEIAQIDRSIASHVKALTQRLNTAANPEELERDVGALNELLQQRLLKIALLDKYQKKDPGL